MQASDELTVLHLELKFLQPQCDGLIQSKNSQISEGSTAEFYFIGGESQPCSARSDMMWSARFTTPGLSPVKIAPSTVHEVAPVGLVETAKITTQAIAHAALDKTRAVGNLAKGAAADHPNAARGAIGGAAVAGGIGTCAGAVTGAAIGAIVGIPAAIFTFGLSIPFCAAAGTAIGGGTGATMGGTTGFIGGGTAGYLYGCQSKQKYPQAIKDTPREWLEPGSRSSLASADTSAGLEDSSDDESDCSGLESEYSDESAGCNLPSPRVSFEKKVARYERACRAS
jgi:hypothetical protein